jgi:uncharacterized protein
MVSSTGLQYYPLGAFSGLAAGDGRVVKGDDHLRASIRDILTTPLGSRVMRRTYGSRLFALMDRPFGPGLAAEIIAATAEALEIWEPRLDLKRVMLRGGASGRMEIDIVYTLATPETYGRERVMENVA